MSNLINQLVQQFRNRSQYENFIRQSQLKFDIKSFQFLQMTQFSARKHYSTLKSKYERKIFESHPRNWHDNQRKIFVWFLLALLKYLKENNKNIKDQHWQQLSQAFFSKDILLLKFKLLSLQKNRKKQKWTQQEDQIIKNSQAHIKSANWNQIAKQIYFKTQGKSFKSSKQCRQRWINHLDDRVKRQQWQPREDIVILKFILQNGKKWCMIAKALGNTRTEHMVKNRFKSLMLKGQIQAKNENKKLLTEEQLVKYIISQTTFVSTSNHIISSIDNNTQTIEITKNNLNKPDDSLAHQKREFPLDQQNQNRKNKDDHNQDFSTCSFKNENTYQSPILQTQNIIQPTVILSHSSSLLSPENYHRRSDSFGSIDFSNFQEQQNNLKSKSSLEQQVSENNIFFENIQKEEQVASFELMCQQKEQKQPTSQKISNSLISKIQNHIFPNF